jgi:UDP-glucuronate 4-epimerase
MKRVFITGIAGFIGFHLALALKKRGDLVVGCDNFNSYYDPALKRKRSALLKREGIDVIEADICGTAPIERVVEEEGITHFVHLAAQAGVRHSLKDPGSYVHSNLDGFVQIMELCRRHPQMKVVYASSSSVYGLSKSIPFNESDPTDQPASLYGATKRANELIAKTYHHLHGLSVTGLRFFTVYGPWGRPDMAYFSFTQAILEGKPIEIYNNGEMQRDFTYIDDIVEGTTGAIDLGAPCEIFNLGNNKPEGVLSLVSIIEELTGKKGDVRLLPKEATELPITYADIAKSRATLGFEPKTSLREGMIHFLNWAREYGSK